MNNKDAVILINKKSGITSFSCLGKIKRNVNKKTGHCGTLDKFANGLMIALCGKYTKLNESFMGLDKTYIARIEFGRQTDTLDPEGEVIKTSPIPSLDKIREEVDKLTGELMQVPPVYSALHVNGKRSYELVRNGQDVQLEPRIIKVFSAEVLSFDSPFLTVKLHVSKGTYIRSWARDLGINCNSCAYVTQLCRTQIGPFSLSEAIDFDDENSLQDISDEQSGALIQKLENYTRIY